MKEHPIKDGEVRKSENGVAIVVGVWQDGEDIKITSKGQFISSVNNNDNSIRKHPHLYGKLKELLIENGKWKS